MLDLDGVQAEAATARMGKPLSRLRVLFLIMIGMLLLAAGTYYYATQIEPTRLTVTYHAVESPALPESFQEIKIAQFSDTHLGEGYSNFQLRQLVQRLNGEEPDMVVFTGDLFDSVWRSSASIEEVPDILSEIEAPLGKYAVYGNHDRGGGGSRVYQEYMKKAGFHVLVNDTADIMLCSGETITIAGLDDYLLGRPDAGGTLSSLNENHFNMLLVHEPDVADRLLDYPLDLILSGHSHGGQVNLPVLGTLIRTSLADNYISGMYGLSGSERGTRLYVNRGIGTTRYKIRLGNPPEISIFTLIPVPR
ncbi:metallophosphoesterase [Paenibacillus sp. N3/727]|uniref:metallophosphoesterase n=1 Tax=Paenibacillus sp. N3/727 TaxID=2925845 RepID=UPI001F5379A3|nr:metallophosphoesterase [Paenibacillus sp. N3/727]UNK21278.1 metallophosphoesterase [Paenibacillus sp. N3/727]